MIIFSMEVQLTRLMQGKELLASACYVDVHLDFCAQDLPTCTDLVDH